MRKKLFLILYISNILLILFYFYCADMFLTQLWGLTYLVFFVASAAKVIDAIAMKRMNPRLFRTCVLYGILTAGILAFVIYAMVRPLDLVVRIVVCAVTALLSVYHVKAAASLSNADEKYVRKSDEVTQDALQAYMMEAMLGRPHKNAENRVRVTVLNIITVLLSILLPMLGAGFRLSWLSYVPLSCMIPAFLHLSRLKYHAAGFQKTRLFVDVLLAFSSVSLLILQRIVSPYSVNFTLVIGSGLFMCPYWLTSHELLCRFQLGWKLVE